jgi:hypothetical protein
MCVLTRTRKHDTLTTGHGRPCITTQYSEVAAQFSPHPIDVQDGCARFERAIRCLHPSSPPTSSESFCVRILINLIFGSGADAEGRVNGTTKRAEVRDLSGERGGGLAGRLFAQLDGCVFLVHAEERADVLPLLPLAVWWKDGWRMKGHCATPLCLKSSLIGRLTGHRPARGASALRPCHLDH